MKQKIANFIELIKPKYSEITTYQIAVMLMLLLIFFPDLRYRWWLMLQGEWELGNPFFFGFLIIVVGGFVLSLWHVFTQRPKHTIEKNFMGSFAIILSGLAGLFATLETLPEAWSIMLIFPLWNYLWGILLMKQLTEPHEAMTDEQATLVDVIIATVIVVLTFSTAHFVFGLSPAMLFSVCLTAASLVSLAVGYLTGYYATYVSSTG